MTYTWQSKLCAASDWQGRTSAARSGPARGAQGLWGAVGGEASHVVAGHAVPLLLLLACCPCPPCTTAQQVLSKACLCGLIYAWPSSAWCAARPHRILVDSSLAVK